jgi:hypothetical protein
VALTQVSPLQSFDAVLPTCGLIVKLHINKFRVSLLT